VRGSKRAQSRQSCWCASVTPSNNPSRHKLGEVPSFLTESSRPEWMNHHEFSRFGRTAEKSYNYGLTTRVSISALLRTKATSDA
jgi:hypothetical protein